MGFGGTTAPDWVLRALSAGELGGVALFTRNLESPEQIAALCASCGRPTPRC
jgi:beta-N-acetylhexosaminidase